MKKIFLLLASFFLLFSFFNPIDASNIFQSWNPEIPYCRWDDCWLKEGIEHVKNSWIDWLITDWTASSYIQRILVYLLTFLRLVAVIIFIYAGFNMLTAWWDEEKFNKSKTMMIYAIIWIAIVFLAWPITNFIIDIFTKS